jgi:hypothetical protein
MSDRLTRTSAMCLADILIGPGSLPGPTLVGRR